MISDGKITATVVEIKPNRFRLDVRQVVLATIAKGELRVASWSPDHNYSPTSLAANNPSPKEPGSSPKDQERGPALGLAFVPTPGPNYYW